MNKFEALSKDIEQSERDKLRSLFPQCFTEGKLDIGKLLNLCGKYIDEDYEKYKFEWKGKAECHRIAGKRSTGTLRPAVEESVNWDTTKNLYIEGDNLEVLKLLQTAYFRKVKMIYIDPPYNTGNDFVYHDDFTDPIAHYKEVTSQATKSNPESMGRFHTNWLNMMWPRLRLAHNLLKEDGLIFVSIDDNEVHNLRKLMDDIFGEENFRNQITVRRGAKSVQAQFDTWDKLGQDVEHILFYTKDSNFRFPKQTKKLDEKKQGTWNNHWRGTDRPTMRYELFGITPDSGQWRWGMERSFKGIENYAKMLADLNTTEDEITQVEIDSYYLHQDEDFILLRLSKTGKPEHYIPPTGSTLLNSSWYDLLIGSSSEISTLFETKVFDTAKLTTVIKRMLNFCENDAVVLDFFSGSATTAHAVMQLNAEDGGNRKYIMIQLPEVTDKKSEAYKAGYKTICEIGKERIRRAGLKIKENNPLATEELDIGFRVFKLDTSNFVAWDAEPIKDNNLQTLWDRFDELAETIKPNRSDLDMVFEVTLKMGVPLDYIVSEITVGSKKCYSVGKKVYKSTEDCLLLLCFEPGITPEDVIAFCDISPEKIITAEAAFEDDTALSNAYYILKNRNVEMKLL